MAIALWSSVAFAKEDEGILRDVRLMVG